MIFVGRHRTRKSVLAATIRNMSGTGHRRRDDFTIPKTSGEIRRQVRGRHDLVTGEVDRQISEKKTTNILIRDVLVDGSLYTMEISEHNRRGKLVRGMYILSTILDSMLE